MKTISVLLSLLLCYVVTSSDDHQRDLKHGSKAGKATYYRPNHHRPNRYHDDYYRPNHHRPNHHRPNRYHDDYYHDDHKFNHDHPKYNDGGFMCVDLGRLGKHTLHASAKLRALTKLRYASKGRCLRDDGRFKNDLGRSKSYCAEFNHRRVTIRAPEGLRGWMFDSVKVDLGACRQAEDIIIISEY